MRTAQLDAAVLYLVPGMVQETFLFIKDFPALFVISIFYLAKLRE